MLKLNATIDDRQNNGAVRVCVFPGFRQHLARAVQPCQRFSDLGADAGDLRHRRNQKSHEHGVTEKSAYGHVSGKNLARAHIHDDGAHNTQHQRG